MEAVFLLPLIWGLAMEVVASCCWHGGSVPVALNLGSHGGCCQLLARLGLAWRLLPVVVGMEAVFLLPLIWGLAMEVGGCCQLPLIVGMEAVVGIQCSCCPLILVRVWPWRLLLVVVGMEAVLCCP